MIRFQALFLVAAVALAGCATPADPEPVVPATESVRVVPASEVEWGHLNPLRGDKSPGAGTLWGDRQAAVPSGFLVRFVDGFSSPPHIHPVTYRGVVISGLVHNDVPDAEETWLPPGSFWTQPAGEVHITAARGSANVAYIEIEKGPYLVRPSDEAFERPEPPVKISAADMAWSEFPGAAADEPKIARLAGNPRDDRLSRALVRLPAGFAGAVRSDGESLHVVVIQGRVAHEVSAETEIVTLGPGSYFGSGANVAHQLTCEPTDECVLYVRTDGTLEVFPND